MRASTVPLRPLRGLTAVVVAAPLVLAGCSDPDDDLVAEPAPNESPVTTLVHLSDIRPGMCVDTSGLPEDGSSSYLQVADCGGSHDAEVFAVPGADADPASCPDHFADYVGVDPEASDLEIRAVTPDTEAEAAADTGPVCLAVSPEYVTGSVGEQGS